MWRANQKNDAHVFEYYTDNNHIAWTYTLSIVVSSSGSHAINDDRWTCTDSGYCFGATVYGTVTGRMPTLTRTGNLTITCSPNGTITGTTK